MDQVLNTSSRTERRIMLLRVNQISRMRMGSGQLLQRRRLQLLEHRRLDRKDRHTRLHLDLSRVLLHLQLRRRQEVVKDYTHPGRRRGRRSFYWQLLLRRRRLFSIRAVLEIQEAVTYVIYLIYV